MYRIAKSFCVWGCVLSLLVPVTVRAVPEKGVRVDVAVALKNPDGSLAVTVGRDTQTVQAVTEEQQEPVVCRVSEDAQTGLPGWVVPTCCVALAVICIGVFAATR